MAAVDVDYRQALGDAHLDTLKVMLQWPALYTQRVVERVSFPSTGGEHWQRNVQIWIPPLDRGDYGIQSAPQEPSNGQLVVSLGLFRRARFPEFAVADADGSRLTLLTRDQHQHCVTMSTLLKYLTREQWNNAPNAAEEEWLTVYALLGDFITDIAGARAHDISEIIEAGSALFRALDTPDIDAAKAKLKADCENLAQFTHYLCWVPARWGDTVSLSASYTMAAKVRLAGERKPLAPTPDGTSALQRLRMRFYTRVGLCPVCYDFRTPTHDHTGSYYFTIEPPDDAHVCVVGSGPDLSFDHEPAETDSEFPTYHVHNDTASDEGRSIEDAKISAFLKGNPVDNAAVMAIAAFNVVLAFLVQGGVFFPFVADHYDWIQLAPTILVGIAAQHRARAHTQVTRPLQTILWAYLAVNVLFVASVSFDALPETGLTRVLGDEDVASAVMLCLSVGLIALLVASRYFDRGTRSLYGRREAAAKKKRTEERSLAGESDREDESIRIDYLSVARRYGDISIGLTAAGLALIVALMVTLGWGGERHAEAKRANAIAGAGVQNPTTSEEDLARTYDFDVFLAYNGGDRATVERLADHLLDLGLRPWLAPREIPPGRRFQTEIEQAIDRVASAAIIVGPNGLGRWQALELQALMAEHVEGGLPLIPVLLPTARVPHELKFLRQLDWVRFKRHVHEKRVLEALRWGITGERPAASRRSGRRAP